MQDLVNEKKSLFTLLKDNYLLAVQDSLENFKSEHWDVFGEGFEQLIDRKYNWDRMLRNALTIGFNDNLLSISNKRFKDNNPNYWLEIRKSNLEDIISEEDETEPERSRYLRLMHLIRLTDIKFVHNNCPSFVGSPVIYDIDVSNEYGLKLKYNLHDCIDTYHAWLILRTLRDTKKEKYTISEIGSGYGGLVSKLKNNLPKAKFILFDLPEVNAVQNYYLKKVFPEKKFLGYREFKEKGKKIFREDFDFLILPGWTIKDLEKQSIDTFINIRSLMEMNKEMLHFYLSSIYKCLRIGGTFSCFNRYVKKVGESENRLADYPFGNDWEVLLSQVSFFQKHIHQLILERMKKSYGKNFSETLKDLNIIPRS